MITQKNLSCLLKLFQPMALSRSCLLPNLFLCYIFITLINYGKTTEVCKNHNYTIISDARRSTSNVYNTTRGDKYLCDRNEIQESIWYRFEIANGNKLATTRPKVNHCGTYSPIWMNGSHPTVVDGVVLRKACAHIPSAFPIGCRYSYDIKVLNCNGFYVYQLKPPKSCFLAYCIGKSSACILLILHNVNSVIIHEENFKKRGVLST